MESALGRASEEGPPNHGHSRQQQSPRLQTLISYFVRNDAQFASIGIPSIIDYIKEAQARDPDTLSPEHLFDLMDRVAVRRTRRFVKQAYLHDRIFQQRRRTGPGRIPDPHSAPDSNMT